MSTPQLERLREHCHQLRLYQVENELTARLEQAAKQEISYAEFLDELLALEVGSKAQKHHQMRIAMARFPFQKTLESFDFKFQPSIDPKQIRELTTGRYMESGDNVLFLGPPGVGKSHLAVALGMKACEQGVRTLFSSATALIAMLGKALAEGRLDERLKVLSQPQLLIIDEIGYLPIDRQGANLFFQLVSRRYERGSIIITSNQSLGAWGEVFGDSAIACSIIRSRSTSKAKASGSKRSSRPDCSNLNSIARRTHERGGLYGAARARPPRAPPTELNPVGEFQMINVGDFRMIIDTDNSGHGTGTIGILAGGRVAES